MKCGFNSFTIKLENYGQMRTKIKTLIKESKSTNTDESGINDY